MADRIKQKDEFAKCICFFLAEQLRTKKITLKRAAEIAEKMLANINLLDTERDFLRLTKELSKDFEELVHLEEQANFRVIEDDRQTNEGLVREFVICTLAEDLKTATAILQDAVSAQGENIETLKAKYPTFKKFIEHNQYDANPKI
jgi:hypothetical protein